MQSTDSYSLKEEKINKLLVEIRDQRKVEEKKIKKRLQWGGTFVVLGFGLSIFMPYIVTTLPWGSIGVYNSNEIGDTIGGIMGPSVGLIGAVLTFLAFYAQIKANTEQRYQFRESLAQQKYALEQQTDQFITTLNQQEIAATNQKLQAESQLNLAQKQTSDAQIATRRDRFANRYYMMMSVHRENVEALEVGRPGSKYIGRRAFPSLFSELQFLYWTTVEFHNKWSKKERNKTLNSDQVFQVSYMTFFFGFGVASTPMVTSLVGQKLVRFTKDLHGHLEVIRISHDNLRDSTKKSDRILTVPTNQGQLEYDEYDLGTGHLHRLSHYFRHLYQTVKYVEDQDSEIFDYSKKYSYVSNLRSQLSVHEQLLLYYNAISVLGAPWLNPNISEDKKEGLLCRYCMLRSIPINTSHFYKSPITLGKKNKVGKPMFEWVEIKERMKNLTSSNPPPKS